MARSLTMLGRDRAFARNRNWAVSLVDHGRAAQHLRAQREERTSLGRIHNMVLRRGLRVERITNHISLQILRTLLEGNVVGVTMMPTGQ